MRLKHNKKRNTAFLFEVVAREYVKAVIKKNLPKQATIKAIIKENFSKNSILNEELSLYRGILETSNIEKDDAVSLIKESKERYSQLPRKQIFVAQSKLIKEMNYKLGQNVFNNFVPNFKDLATIYNIFNNKTSIKEKILLEKRLVSEVLTVESSDNTKQHVDNLTYKTFVNKFNEKYSELHKDQKDLLTSYIASFADNSVSLKVHLNDQIHELKEKLRGFESNEIFAEGQMKEKYDNICLKLENYKDQNVDDNMVEEVLRIQQLVRELQDVG